MFFPSASLATEDFILFLNLSVYTNLSIYSMIIIKFLTCILKDFFFLIKTAIILDLSSQRTQIPLHTFLT